MGRGVVGVGLVGCCCKENVGWGKVVDLVWAGLSVFY
jgi:hypothetical protein